LGNYGAGDGVSVLQTEEGEEGSPRRTDSRFGTRNLSKGIRAREGLDHDDELAIERSAGVSSAREHHLADRFEVFHVAQTRAVEDAHSQKELNIESGTVHERAA